MTAREQVLQNIERVGEISKWSGWQIRFVQAGATLLGRNFPGLSDPDISDAQLIDLANGLSRELLDVSTSPADGAAPHAPSEWVGQQVLQSIYLA
jgi:hypothetical protein